MPKTAHYLASPVGQESRHSLSGSSASGCPRLLCSNLGVACSCGLISRFEEWSASMLMWLLTEFNYLWVVWPKASDSCCLVGPPSIPHYVGLSIGSHNIAGGFIKVSKGESWPARQMLLSYNVITEVTFFILEGSHISHPQWRGLHWTRVGGGRDNWGPS